MIRLLSESLQEDFYELLDGVSSIIRFICPFVGPNTASRLADIVGVRGVQAFLITRFSRADFFKGVSSIHGLEKLALAGVRIKAVKNLHAKFYLLDSSALILGSSNFTDGGFLHNLEINVIVEDEPEVIERAEACFTEIDGAIDPLFEVSLEKIIKEREFLDNLPLSPRGVERSFARSFDFGAVLTSAKLTDEVEEFIRLPAAIDLAGDAWLKFEGLVERRHPGEETATRQRTGGAYITSFPKRPLGIKQDDTIFLAILSFNRNGQPMPMIVGYGQAEGFDPANVHSPEAKTANPLLERYPYYVRLTELRLINAPASEGVPMSELYSRIGNAAFPSTRAIPVSTVKLHQLHHRRDKLRLTSEAKAFLIEELEKTMAAHGVK